MFALKRNFARRKSGGFIEFPAAERTHSPHTHTRTQTQAHINKQAHREAGRHLKALIMPQWQWPPSLEPSGNLARILKESLREIHKLQSKTEREREEAKWIGSRKEGTTTMMSSVILAKSAH